MIAWISYIGSFVGLLTGIFVLFDRLLAGRPMLTIQRTEAAGRERELSLVVRNRSDEDILVTVFPPKGRNCPTFRLRDVPSEPKPPFEALVPSQQARGFALAEMNAQENASTIDFQIKWTRVRSTWLPQLPCVLRTTNRRLREMETAL